MAAWPAEGRSKRYSALLLRRRMKIMAPSATASRAQTMRSVVESIPEAPFRLLIGRYMFFSIGIRSRTSFVSAGPMVTTNREGNMQKNTGNTSLTASLAARSSARCRAIIRR